MPEIQVMVVKANGDLEFRFVDYEMRQRTIIVENADSQSQEVVEGQKWWATITDTASDKKNRKGPVTVRLIRRIDVPKLQVVESLEDFWIEPKKLQHIQILLLSGKNVMLIGHKGTGKTSFAYSLANAWGCAICKVDCGTLQTPNALFGSEAAEKGQTVWRPSDFWKFCQTAISTPSELFLLLADEINRINAKTAEAFHGLFDFTRQVAFTTTEGTKVFKLPPNVMTIATRNMGAQYTGTHSMDAALVDRFVPFMLGYMPASFEEAQLVKNHGLHSKQAELIVKAANSMRTAEHAGTLAASPSPRLTDAAATLVKHGVTVADAIETAFLGGFDRGIAMASGDGERENEETDYHQARSHIRKFLKDVKLAA